MRRVRERRIKRGGESVSDKVRGGRGGERERVRERERERGRERDGLIERGRK